MTTSFYAAPIGDSDLAFEAETIERYGSPHRLSPEAVFTDDLVCGTDPC